MPWVPEVIQGAVRQGCWVKVMLQPMLWPGWPSVPLLVSAGLETLQDLLSPLSMGTAASQPVGFSLKAGKLRYRDLFIPYPPTGWGHTRWDRILVMVWVPTQPPFQLPVSLLPLSFSPNIVRNTVKLMGPGASFIISSISSFFTFRRPRGEECWVNCGSLSCWKCLQIFGLCSVHWGLKDTPWEPSSGGFL